MPVLLLPSLIFEGAPHFCFAWGLTNYVGSPAEEIGDYKKKYVFSALKGLPDWEGSKWLRLRKKKNGTLL